MDSRMTRTPTAEPTGPAVMCGMRICPSARQH